jgi:hypothetical protein
MAGDERQLRHEMLAAALGKEPDSNFWEQKQAFQSYFSGQGSQNIWLMRFATQALKDMDVPWEAVYHYQLGPPSGSRLVARNGSLNVVSEPAPGDTVFTPGFGGSEFMSTIYWSWHLMSHVALMKKGGAIGAKARRWVVLNWLLFRAIQAHDGSLMLFGQRSAGHNPKPRELDWLFALASGGDLGRAEKWCKQAGAGLKRGWEFKIGNALKAEMQSAWEEARTMPLEELKSLPLRVPTEIVKTTEGLAVVHSATCNSNTPPILAGTFWQNGRRDILPTSDVRGEKVPGGIRIRQKFDHATARIEGGEIVYASSLYTNGAEQRIPLPGGDVIYHLKLGSGNGSTAPVPVDTAVIEPPLPDGEPPFPDLAHAAELIAGLQLPSKMQAARARIVARLESGEVDDDALAEIIKQVEDFKINPAQVQAAAVREAIAILESI